MKRLLFIEDDIITGSIYRHHFKLAGYEVELADDGEKALKALSRFKPDIVVLDLLLPKFNGLEILRRIRADPDTRALPVIVFTNAFASDLAREAMRAGATQCLSKAKTTAPALLAAIRSDLGEPGVPLVAAIERVVEPGPDAKRSAPAPAAAVGPSGADPHESFRTHTPQALAEMRGLVQNLLKAGPVEARGPLILSLQIKAHSLTSTAGLAQAGTLAQMASALAILLKDLYEKPSNLNASTLRTVNQSVDFLAVLFDQAIKDTAETQSSEKILVVEDDPVARKAASVSLARAQLKAATLEDPVAACALLAKDAFDLVITDVNMPGMNGFELCEKLRATQQNAKTPVIFVTALDDFSARLRSATSGGDDFIAKPYLPMELAAKALIHLLRGRLPRTASVFKSFRPGS